MLTKLFQWGCRFFDISFRTLDYVITSHQALLSKTTKHWDSFVSHCTYTKKPWPGLVFEEAKATSGQAKVRDFRQSQARTALTSTGNMHRHTKKCWGMKILTLAMVTANVTEVWQSLAKPKDGSIAKAFNVKGKDKATYSYRQHTKTETRYFFAHCINLQLTLVVD